MPTSRRLVLMCLATLFVGIVAAAELPRSSPDFSVKLNDGSQISLSQYKEKVVVLAFILTSCPHCQKTVGTLSKMQTEYGSRGFQAVASAIEDMAAMNVPDFIKRFQPPFPVGFSERNAALEYLQHPAMFRLLMPQVVFLDRSGTIRAQYAGDDKFLGDDQEQNFRAQIETLLAERAPTAKKGGTAKPRK